MEIRPVLLVIDMQNGFCAPGGTFDKFGFDIQEYRTIIPRLKKFIAEMRQLGVPIYFSKAVRESSGLDCIDRVHQIIPDSRRERIERMPLCIRGTWDSDIIEEISPLPEDHIVEKRRDSVFQDTEFELWIKALGANTIIFAGIDTFICVESTVRDAFNRGYDVILISDCVASRNPKHHHATLEQVNEAFGWALTSEDLLRRFEKKELSIALQGAHPNDPAQ